METSKIVIAGGTGFVGTALARALVADGHGVVVLSRRENPRVPAGVRSAVWRPGSGEAETPGLEEALEGARAVVNLAGESIAGGRWTKAQKLRIHDSRISSTKSLVDAVKSLPSSRRPSIFISSSAVGYYGSTGDEPLDEASPPGDDFLARVCVDWEAEARRAEDFGLRTAFIRTGLVLGTGGGALPRMLLPFRLFVGGPMGSGNQWMSWVHLDDLVGLYRAALKSPDAAGPFNGTAPNPVTNREFAKAVGEAMGRPSRLPAPAPLLRLALGEMADALLLGGQRVLPRRAEDLEFVFRYPHVGPALFDILD